MKRIISLLLAAAVLSLCSFSAFAADTNKRASGKTTVTIGDWVYEVINGGSNWELDEYVGEGGDVVVPRIVNDKMVVSIGSYCFSNNTTVKTVSTSSPLWTVDEYAFLKCTSLESFECNFALKEIGVGAFSDTSSLTKINLEDSVVTVISPHAFMNSGLAKVKLPETCTTIGNYAFAQCQDLNKVYIPDSVTEIADTAFNGCDNLVIICSANSYAAQYAQAKGITWVTPDDFIVGDVNNNGSVTIRDATYIQLYSIGRHPLDKIAFARSDVDGNGKVNIRDVTYIQLYLVGRITSFDNLE